MEERRKAAGGSADWVHRWTRLENVGVGKKTADTQQRRFWDTHDTHARMHDNKEKERSMASGNGTVALVSRALFLVVLVVVIIVVVVLVVVLVR